MHNYLQNVTIGSNSHNANYQHQAQYTTRKNQGGKNKQQTIGMSMLNQSTDYQVSSVNTTQLTGIVKGSAASR